MSNWESRKTLTEVSIYWLLTSRVKGRGNTPTRSRNWQSGNINGARNRDKNRETRGRPKNFYSPAAAAATRNEDSRPHAIRKSAVFVPCDRPGGILAVDITLTSWFWPQAVRLRFSLHKVSRVSRIWFHLQLFPSNIISLKHFRKYFYFYI